MLAVHGQSVAREDDDLGRSSHLCVSDSLAVCYRQEPKSPLPQLDTSTFFFSVLFLVYNVYTKIVNTSRELNHFIRQTVCRFPSKDFKYITVPCLSLLTSWLRMRFTISFWCLWCREESKKIMRRSIVGKNEGERTSHRVGLVWKWNPHIFISMKRVQFRYWRLTRLFLGIHLEMQLESSPSSTCVKQNNNVPPPLPILVSFYSPSVTFLQFAPYKNCELIREANPRNRTLFAFLYFRRYSRRINERDCTFCTL